MIETVNLLLIAGLTVMAILCWHRGIPAVLADGKGKAIELFLLGMVLGLYAAAQMNTFFVSPHTFSFYHVGPHVILLVYAIMRYWRLVRERHRYWGQAKGR